VINPDSSADVAGHKPAVTHCSSCGREINGAEPRTCVVCMTDHSKLTKQYGPRYAAKLGDLGGR
jgi:hypothetical protein